MTSRCNRQYDHDVRRFQREQPGTTLEQARQAVHARASEQQTRLALIPAAPLPQTGERCSATSNVSRPPHPSKRYDRRPVSDTSVTTGAHRGA